MQTIEKTSRTHGLSYVEHFTLTMSIAYRFALASVGCVVHSVFPQMCSKFSRRVGRKAYESLLLEGTYINVDKLIMQNIILKRMMSEISSAQHIFDESKILKEIDEYEFD